jgi:hypothetical protein
MIHHSTQKKKFSKSAITEQCNNEATGFYVEWAEKTVSKKKPDVFTFHIIQRPDFFIWMLTLPNSMSDFGPQENPLFTYPPNQLQDHTGKFLNTTITMHMQPGHLTAFHNSAWRSPCRTTVCCLADSFRSNTSEKLISISISSSSSLPPPPLPPSPSHVIVLPGELQYALQRHEMCVMHTIWKISL